MNEVFWVAGATFKTGGLTSAVRPQLEDLAASVGFNLARVERYHWLSRSKVKAQESPEQVFPNSASFFWPNFPGFDHWLIQTVCREIALQECHLAVIGQQPSTQRSSWQVLASPQAVGRHNLSPAAVFRVMPTSISGSELPRSVNEMISQSDPENGKLDIYCGPNEQSFLWPEARRLPAKRAGKGNAVEMINRLIRELKKRKCRFGLFATEMLNGVILTSLFERI